MEIVMSRGPNFIYAREFISETYGAELWGKVLDALPESVAEVWKGTMLVTEIYPFESFKAMIKALSEQRGKMADEEIARVYEYIADRSLSSVYKIFFRFANPAFVIKNYPKLWKRFFTTLGMLMFPLQKPVMPHSSFAYRKFFWIGCRQRVTAIQKKLLKWQAVVSFV